MASTSPKVCQFDQIFAPLTILVSVPESKNPLVMGEYRFKLSQVHGKIVTYGFESTMQLSYF